MKSSKYSELDLDKEYVPIWEESPEVYYEPMILELELDKIKKENAELKYQCTELDVDNKRLKTELQTKEKEKTELHNLYKQNTIKLPNYQAKVLELNKDVTKLSTDNKNLLMANSNLKERRLEMEKKYKDAMDKYAALMTTNHQLEKINAKCKLVKLQEHKSELEEKTEKDKKKSKDDELEIQNKALKTQISHQADELRSKEVLAKDLERKNKILASKVEDTLGKLKDSQKFVRVLENKIKASENECSESIIKYSSLNHENIYLKTKLKEADELMTKNDELKSTERGLQKQINMYKRMYLVEQLEKEKLEELIIQLKKEKTRYIYTGEDITIMKRKNEECEKERRELSQKFSDLDCPFYQTKFGKGDDGNDDLKLRCGSITEKQYKNKIFALEHVIKSLHSKIDLIEKKQLQYREIVVESLYDTRNAKNKEKELKALVEKQKYEIIYDKIEVLAKDTRIQKLEIQKNNCDDQCKLLNRQATVLCRKLRNDFKKIESMKKNSLKANKILNDAEEKNKELQIETQQSKKIMQTQLEFKDKSQNLKQLEANKMRSSIEELQKKIYKLQDDANSKQQKIEELTKGITQLRTESESNHKMHSKEMNNAKNEIGRLNIQNNSLTFEIKCLSKLEEENNNLKSKLKVEQNALVYLQKKFDKLFNEKQKNISLMRMPKLF